jgi:ATP-dependent phosphofructokinase / diphosphate-dependent phosphofructokinase
MRVGILTGGGDCPGLNPAIRAVVMRLLDHGFEPVGIELGWKGLVEGLTTPLCLEAVEEIIYQGGTILGSSRTNPFRVGHEEKLDKVLHNVKALGFDAIVALGGEDTLGVASKLYKLGVPTIGIPKTMDNDLDCTDYTFGFDTAVGVALDAADRLRDTARSHRRILVLEVMGRHAGWVALYSGIGAGADWILIPEVALDLKAMCDHLQRCRERGKVYGLVVASEGVDIPHADTSDVITDAFGHVILRERGVGEFVAKEIERRLKVETRFSVLGHVQRGGAPTVFDRVLASRLGIRAADLVKEGDFGKMASIQGNEITAVELEMAVKELKTVPLAMYEQVKSLFNK